MRVIICGAGIAGLALAQRLGRLGADVVVLEQAAGLREQGYMIDFFGPGYDAAEATGTLAGIERYGYRVDELTYRDETGRRRASMSYANISRMVGGRLVSVMRPDLERALREQLPAQIPISYATRPAAVDNRPDGVTVTLEDGRTVEGDLLVGADGIHSWVRHAVFGPGFRRYLGFHTAAWSFADPEAHGQVDGQICLTDTVDRQMGFYPLRDGRVAVFTVHRAPDPALPADPVAALRSVYGSLGWLVPRALAQLPPPARVFYDEVAQIEMPSWSRDRVVLLGDAAYAVSLLAGQGASLGVAGADVLAEHLVREPDIPAALARYERDLRPVVTEKQRVARSGARWFLPASTSQLRLRRAALALSWLPGADRRIATALVGKSTAVITNLHAAGA
ncbi:FAD-dependent monooxygenase [Paractinoplanes rishiriensis]|uniref:FAD-dependent oxidoreductase n=1 Tax=Paractinoplanes rishiriensis TaxID=1050105 RepID=A0A919K7C6_9ACTN|nr:FAD-dependent monooxygenase [Actinoplanes rishiriensis]GIF00040.1 FAD-dependent oxidoreductase [Actinoplanes rishiriensis]